MRTSIKKRSATSAVYVERVNLAIDYIVTHLAEPMCLKDISRVAMMSPFHFHRVFQMQVGVTIADFVKRLRLDRALFAMAHARKTSLTQIALASGFTSSSDFSRSFKQRFGVAPSAFDLADWRGKRKGELESMLPTSGEPLHVKQLVVAPNPDAFKVKLRDLPARTVAYVRVTNPYQPDAVTQAAGRLVAWADRRGLADGQWLGYQWDNPELVSLQDCQYHVAVQASRFEVKGEVGRFIFPPMKVAQVDIRGPIDQEIRALQWLYGSWLPQSGYVPDDQPCFEAWLGRPFAHGTTHFELTLQLPVRA